MTNVFHFRQRIARILGRSFIVLLIFIEQIVLGREVYNFSVYSQAPLAVRINRVAWWALQTCDGEKVWLIYSTTGKVVGQFEEKEVTKFQSNQPSLEQLIAGSSKITESLSQPQAPAESIAAPRRQASTPSSAAHHPSPLLHKANQYAIILDYSLESGRPKLYQVSYQPLTEPFLMEKRPIFWLGFAEASQSLYWLKKQFYDANYDRLQRQIVKVLGQHDAPLELAEFAKDLIAGDHPVSVKEAAISILQQQPSAQSLRLLIALILKSEDLRLIKKAIASLSQGNDPRGRAFIRSLARQASSPDVRKEAIFWLSQMADARSIQVLHEIMQSNADIEIKESTVFAISQLPDHEARPLLTNIARYDPSVRIRQKARFWMQHTSEQRLPVFLNELIQVDAFPRSK